MEYLTGPWAKSSKSNSCYQIPLGFLRTIKSEGIAPGVDPLSDRGTSLIYIPVTPGDNGMYFEILQRINEYNRVRMLFFLQICVMLYVHNTIKIFL